MSAAPPVAGTAGRRCTCTACPLLCDDIPLTDAGAATDCVIGRDAFAAALPEAAAGQRAATASSRTASPRDAADPRVDLKDDALARAARVLAAGRRILLTGLADATVETVVAACDLAEAVGAAVDVGGADLAAAAGPTIARAGRVTADWDELRDRADLVIFWGCDPTSSHPRFIERFVTPPLVDSRPRRTIAIGPAAVPPADRRHAHLPLDGDHLVEAARLLQLVLADGGEAAATNAVLAAVCHELAAAIREASCVAIVTMAGGEDGLVAWSIVHLVRAIAHRRPVFELPLAAAGCAATTAAAVCTWRYGAAGAIARADRSGGRFLPAEATAARLIARGEVDVVLAVGRLAPDVEAAITAAGPQLTVVRISATVAQPSVASRSLWLRCADPLLTAGTMLRGDGRTVTLAPPRSSPLPSARELLLSVHEAVAAARPPAAGGRA